MLWPVADGPQLCASRDAGDVGALQTIGKARCLKGPEGHSFYEFHKKRKDGAERSLRTPTLKGAREKELDMRS